MTPSEPPTITNYPVASVAIGVAVLSAVVLFFVGRFDPTQGPLTLSIMIALGLLGTIAYCLVFTVPQNDVTSEVVGALSTGFGAVLVYWFGRASGDKRGVQPPEPPKEGPDGHP